MNNNPCHYNLNFLEQELKLTPSKALFWRNRKILIVSDLHLGKENHFRKSGIPIPSGMHQNDLSILDDLIVEYAPSSLIFLGDLFHSEINNQWNEFSSWINVHSEMPIHLVKGNHDILPDHLYRFKNLTVHNNSLTIEPFLFTHKPVETGDSLPLYNISGHLHPAVTLKGNARQSIKLPCFYFGKNNGLLPAFGKFTGSSLIKIKKEDLVYVTTGTSVIAAKILEQL
ncbi:ligase-associated DNA damage response endonuclease PdeM [soil metagenome]